MNRTAFARFMFALASVLFLSSAPAAVAASPDARPVPRTLYPARAHLTYYPSLSNAQVDCQWGFQCAGDDGYPTDSLFHLQTQDELHRIGGWAQDGVVNQRKRLMLFFVFTSHYST